MIKILQTADVKTFLSARNLGQSAVEEVVKPILDDVAARGDAAVREYAKRFDGYDGPFKLTCEPAQVSAPLASAVATAIANIAEFARLQMPREFRHELAPGHAVGQIVRPLERVAAYVPGGRYPMPSSVLMAVVPAKVAGVRDVWVTTPSPVAETVFAAQQAGADHIVRIGGAHAIAAFAFGTESIPKVDRIVGPGNIYVATAKKLLSGIVGIDFVAGPTEVVIVADEGTPAWIAADLLAQAEHDPDSAAILVTTNQELAESVAQEIEHQLSVLPTAAVARQAIDDNSAIIVTGSKAESMDYVNRIAPEHLCLHDPADLDQVQHAGGVFLGQYSAEALGDYASGPNHVLPTGGVARLRGGLSVTDFVKVISIQELSRECVTALAHAVIELARAEGLEAHARSVEVRL